MHEQHLPMQVHVGQQPMPVDVLMLAQDDVRDVGAVVAVAVLDEEFRDDQFGGRGDARALSSEPSAPRRS